MHEVSTNILAAGQSHRIGARNKLLLPIGGVPMIRHLVNVYSAAIDGPVLVVTGHEAHVFKAGLEGRAAVTVVNSNYAQGQPISVACGLRDAADAAVILIGLGDQPLLTAADIRALLLAHTHADVGWISIPKLGDQRGNQIVVPAALRAQLLADPRSPGCKKFTRDNPERVQFLAFEAPRFYTDIDTPEAYDALASLGKKAV